MVFTPAAQTLFSMSGSTLYLDMGDGFGGAGSVSFSSSPEADFRLFYEREGSNKAIIEAINPAQSYISRNPDSEDYEATDYDLGQLIDSSYVWESSAKVWRQDSNRLVGVRFTDADNGLHYGWIDLNVDLDSDRVDSFLTVQGFAYEQRPDVAIAAGATAIPEPATTALAAALVAGSAAAYQRRRKRKLEGKASAE